MTERVLPFLRKKKKVEPEPGSQNLEAFMNERKAWWTKLRNGNTFGCLADAHRDAWVLESLGGVTWDCTITNPENTDVLDYRMYVTVMNLEGDIPF